MLSTLLTVTIAHQNIQTVNNGRERNPKDSHQVIRDIAKLTNMSLYAPESSLKGYLLNSIEIADIPVDKKFPGLNKRVAVRMVFLNKSTTSVIELIQTPSAKSIIAKDHTKWLFSGKFFATGLMADNTFVAQKLGSNDVGMQGGLISEPSAKIVMGKMVEIKP